jgi:ABC-type sugar transport system permease subunit
MASSRLWRWQHRFAPLLFISPFLVLFSIFLLYPLARSLYLSFCSTAGPKHVRFTGLANYEHLAFDPYFWVAAANTAVYVLVYLLIQIPLSVGLALLLNSAIVRFKNFFRFAFFSTHLVGQVFVAVVFAQLLGPRNGLITRFLSTLGGPMEIPWLTDPILSRVSILLAWLWLSIGYGMIFCLAALQSVDRNLYEAAEMDGAGNWARFFHITLPGIRPVLVFLILVGLIGGFQLFELPFVLFRGPGPGLAGMTIVMYLFTIGFQTGNLGYASTIGWALALIILIAAILQLWLTGETEDA